MSDTAFDLILCGLILWAALAAVAGRGLFRAVVFFILYGVLVAVAWLRIDALDVALAEAAIGAGLTGVLLLGAVARLTRLQDAEGAAHAASARQPRNAVSTGRTLGGALAVAIVAAGASVALGWAFLTLPPPQGLQDEVATHLGTSGVENPVTAVLLNFRAWDTLLESVILLTALIGVWAFAPEGSWGQRVGVVQHVRRGGVLVTFGRVLPPIGFLIGVYLVWAGAAHAGGAFQGGTVLAAVGLLVAMAGLLEPPRVTAQAWRLALVAGPAVFLGAGLLGMLAGGFMVVPPGHAKALILGIEAALTLSIAVTLALAVLGPPAPDDPPVASDAGVARARRPARRGGS